VNSWFFFTQKLLLLSESSDRGVFFIHRGEERTRRSFLGFQKTRGHFCNFQNSTKNRERERDRETERRKEQSYGELGFCGVSFCTRAIPELCCSASERSIWVSAGLGFLAFGSCCFCSFGISGRSSSGSRVSGAWVLCRLGFRIPCRLGFRIPCRAASRGF
jgi:hypothetical protein